MRVLLLVHGFPPAAAGGTELYSHDYARTLRDSFADDVFVLTREADRSRPEYGIRRECRDGITILWINNTFRACRSVEESYRNPEIRQIGASFVEEVDPDIAHVQHLTCLSTELVTELAARRVPIVYTLNDYWLLCHRGQLVDVDLARCGGPSVDGCARCIGSMAVPRPLRWAAPAGRAVGRVLPTSTADRLATLARAAASFRSQARREAKRRLDHVRSLLPLVSEFIAPSRTLAERYRAYGVPDSRMLVQEQGIDQTRLCRVQHEPAERLRLGFLGSLMVSKAPHVLLEAVRRLPQHAVSVQLYGAVVPYHGDDTYRARLEPLLQQANVHHVGPVPHEDVADVLATIDVLVVPSVWIENAPFVIREAFAARVPVVASRLGGMAELVSDERSGLLFEPGSSEDLSRVLRRLLDDPGLLDRLRSGIPSMRTMEEDAERTRGVYARHLPAPKCALATKIIGTRPHGPADRTGARLAAVVLNYRTPEDTVIAARALAASARPVDDLIIVNNGSDDGVERWLGAGAPGACVLDTGRNLGFAGGCNVGLRAALERGADLIAVVNSDVVIAPDMFVRLEEALAADPSLGIVGPVVLSRAHPTSVASCGMTFSPTTGRMRHLEAGRDLRHVALAPIVEVDGVSGCAMLVRRSVVDRVGLFAEDYFFSFEDLDFCLRARDAGYRSACVTTALAYHEGGRTIGRRSAQRVYFATRNHLSLAARRRHGSAAGALLRTLSILGFNLAYVLWSGEVPRLTGLLAYTRGAADHVARRYGGAPARFQARP